MLNMLMHTQVFITSNLRMLNAENAENAEYAHIQVFITSIKTYEFTMDGCISFQLLIFGCQISKQDINQQDINSYLLFINSSISARSIYKFQCMAGMCA